MLYRVARIVAVLSVFAVVGPTSGWSEPWQHEIGRDHPAVGQIFAAGQAIDEAGLIDRIVAADFLLLGEKHDNGDHHRLQARLLRRVVARGRQVGVAFEVFSTDRQAAIDDHIARTGSVDDLEQVVDWAASGWPDWSYYRPLLQIAVQAGAPVLAANLPRSELKAIFKQGAAVLPPALVAGTGLDRPLEAAAGDRLHQALVASHCGMAPDTVIAGMTNIQRARDALMAERLASLPAGVQGVLIAGAGHVRRDFGVPFYLSHLRPGARIVSLAFREIDLDGDTAPEAAQSAFDYVWMTPRVDNDDPCATHRQQLKKLPKR
jgi:uncharacterized iron-regulated protein